jgi:UDP-N-acetylenolpyruvoylglucosamine reductase
MATLQEKVRAFHGINLEPEVEIWGPMDEGSR